MTDEYKPQHRLRLHEDIVFDAKKRKKNEKAVDYRKRGGVAHMKV